MMNVQLILALPSFFSFLFGMYITYKLFVYRKFSIFFLVLGLLGFFDFFGLALVVKSAKLMYSIALMSFIIAIAIYAHITLYYPKYNLKTNNKKLIISLIYGFSIIGSILSFFVIKEMKFSIIKYNQLMYIWIMIAFGYVLFSTYNLFEKIKKMDYMKRELKVIMIFINSFFIVVFFNDYFLNGINIETIKLLGSVMFLMGLGILFGINQYDLFNKVPVAENEKKEQSRKYKLLKKKSYIIATKVFEDSFKVFVDQINHGKSGLIISRINPIKLKGEYNLKKTKAVWLTRNNDNNKLDPTNPEEITYEVKKILDRAANGIIILDGIEYVSGYNTFKSTIWFLQNLKDLVSKSNSTLIIPIHKDAFEESEYAYIIREFRRVKI